MELKKAKKVLHDWNKAEEVTIRDPKSIEFREIYIERKEAIETTIQELERLQKENEELKYLYNKALTDVVVGIDLDNTYIKKEKIMKYKKEAENAECKSALEAVCIGAIIGVLDGLLEE